MRPMEPMADETDGAAKADGADEDDVAEYEGSCKMYLAYMHFRTTWYTALASTKKAPTWGTLVKLQLLLRTNTQTPAIL